MKPCSSLTRLRISLQKTARQAGDWVGCEISKARALFPRSSSSRHSRDEVASYRIDEGEIGTADNDSLIKAPANSIEDLMRWGADDNEAGDSPDRHPPAVPQPVALYRGMKVAVLTVSGEEQLAELDAQQRERMRQLKALKAMRQRAAGAPEGGGDARDEESLGDPRSGLSHRRASAPSRGGTARTSALATTSERDGDGDGEEPPESPFFAATPSFAHAGDYRRRSSAPKMLFDAPSAMSVVATTIAAAEGSYGDTTEPARRGTLTGGASERQPSIRQPSLSGIRVSFNAVRRSVRASIEARGAGRSNRKLAGALESPVVVVRKRVEFEKSNVVQICRAGRHPKIVTCFGFVELRTGEQMLLSELMGRGTLADLLSQIDAEARSARPFLREPASSLFAASLHHGGHACCF